MGCDIHFFAEKRNQETGAWEFLPAPADGYDWKEKDLVEGEGGTYEPAHPYRFGSTRAGCKPGYDDRYNSDDDPPCMRDWFDDRNYSLFGMLADVRNGSGFAGIDTGDSVEPMVEPRGWPPDLSPELELERACIEHTPSWLTVKEMQDYFDRKRTEKIVVRGVVDGFTYERLRDKGETPRSWCGDISGGKTAVLAPVVYDSLPSDMFVHKTDRLGTTTTLNDDMLPNDLVPGVEGKTVFVRAEWLIPFGNPTERFEACLEEMLEVSGRGPEDVRAVFYFDS